MLWWHAGLPLRGGRPAATQRYLPHTRPSSSAAGAASVVHRGLLTTWLARHPQPDLAIKAQAVVLLDVGTRQVLWERDPIGRRAPASLTKLITAMVVADQASFDREVGVMGATDMAAIQQAVPDATVMGLTAGEILTVRELLYGLFLRSGNDAAETLATIPGRATFIDEMNQKVAELGMTGSHFSSPVGLDAPDMYTTARDLAIAAATIVASYPALLAISGTPLVDLPQTPVHKAYPMVNYNRLVISGQPWFYPGATGMKTAFTDDAGPSMVATANRDGRRMVAVILHSDNFFADAHVLLDYGYSLPGAA
jgi:D-alanyl-D-alanine carboxypeptidase